MTEIGRCRLRDTTSSRPFGNMRVPRYFFDTVAGPDSFSDEDGIELTDVFAAQEQAVSSSGEMLRDMGAKLLNKGDWSVEVFDSDHRILFRITVTTEEFVIQRLT